MSERGSGLPTSAEARGAEYKLGGMAPGVDFGSHDVESAAALPFHACSIC